MKKKHLLLIFCLLILPLCAYADDDSLKNERAFELGFANLNFYFSNDFLFLSDVLQETIVIDIDKFSNGFNLNFGLNIIPVYLKINFGDWGIGLTSGVEATGSFSLSGKLLTFDKAVDDKSYINGALFASAGVNGFYNYQKFKFFVQPSVFYTLAYIQPDMSYTFDPDSGNIFHYDYDIKIFTPFPAENPGSVISDLSTLGLPGIDFTFGVEYALSKDFDMGLKLVNIPIIPSVLHNYTLISGSVGSGEPMDPLRDGMSSLFSSFNSLDNDPVYGTDTQETARPFRLSTWINWRLFGTPFFTLTPMIGFSINKLYAEEFSMEIGINGRVNLANTFYATAGINYIDRLWINSIDLALDLRLLEINIGVDMRSHEFIKSWTAGGIGITTGFKLGL